jgi:hypothetical protein
MEETRHSITLSLYLAVWPCVACGDILQECILDLERRKGSCAALRLYLVPNMRDKMYIAERKRRQWWNPKADPMEQKREYVSMSLIDSVALARCWQLGKLRSRD